MTVELDEVVRLAQIEARGEGYAEVQPAHLLIAIAPSTRAALAKVKSAPVQHRHYGPDPERRVPLSVGALQLVNASRDRASLLVALAARGPLHVRAAAREVVVSGVR